MKAIRTLALIFTVALLFSAFDRPARADAWDKTTIVTFGDYVQLPGTVLSPGTYVFKLVDSNSDRHIVLVFDQNQTKLITTVMAIPNYRLQPTDGTVIRYAERPADQPPAIDAWFYPGDNFGQQFVYPKSESQQLARVNETNVPSTGSEQVVTQDTSSAAPEAAPQSAPAQSTPAAAPQSAPPQPDSAPAATTNTSATSAEPASSAPASTDTDATQLPKTASLLPLIGLVGLLLIATALVLKRKARTRA